MSSIVTYSADGSTHTFVNPRVTVTQVQVPSRWAHKRQLGQVNVTVRALMIAANGTELTLKEHTARDILSRVGGTFKWVDGQGSEILTFGPQTDTRFGPHPGAVDFNRFHGSKCTEIIWSLNTSVGPSTHIKGLPAQDDANQVRVLELAYTIATSLDQAMYTTRTCAGILKLSSAGLTRSSFQGADAYRNTVEAHIPACPVGWQRIARDYQMDETGLELAFSVVDQQKYAVLPQGIVDGDVTLTASNRQAWLSEKAEFTLEGYFEAVPTLPDRPIEALVALASNVWDFEGASEGILIQNITFRQSLYRPRLSFSMTWDAWGDQRGVPGSTTGVRNANWCLFLIRRANSWLNDYKNAVSTSHLPYGTTKVAGWHGSDAAAPVLSVTEQAGGGGLPAHSEGAPSNTDTGPSYSKASPAWGYTYWHQNFKYKIDHGVRSLPVLDSAMEDVVVVLHKPQVLVYVTGEATRGFEPPDIPGPPYPDAQAVTLKSEFSHDSANIGPYFTSTWRYVQKLKLVNGESGFVLPANLKVPYSPLPTGVYASEGVHNDIPYPATEVPTE